MLLKSPENGWPFLNQHHPQDNAFAATFVAETENLLKFFLHHPASNPLTEYFLNP
ncbi:hypothetical protein TSAR_012988 [Trichomalopsis sarcophagae]|uniref:Uncharacterized protein n=1 Tax=Trichomalopsis sarcophagae TaxID=543379 RepID=A0A232ETW3_9HYME|nr:hypothetical protein TSAR_012988 [Trichomalopsis sarcophagae]